MPFLRFECKDSIICKKRGGKILILGRKMLFLHQLIENQSFTRMVIDFRSFLAIRQCKSSIF